MSYKVAVAFYIPGVSFDDESLAPLGEIHAEVSKGLYHTEDELIVATKDADAVIGGPFPSYNRRVLEAIERCRILAITGIGYENVDLEAATDQGIVVTNVPDYCLDEVSDHTIALMMAMNRKLFPVHRLVTTEGLSGSHPRMRQEVLPPLIRLRDCTLGLVGLGSIGRVVAMKARGMVKRVLACDPFISPLLMETIGVEVADLDTLLRQSDFVSLHCNLTPQNRHLLNYDVFQKMKRTAYLINTARGGLVDEGDLVRALREGLIAGAGLDVTEQEPVSLENPLREMDNVILTGHTGQFSNLSQLTVFRRPGEEVVRALTGQWPLHVLNPAVKPKFLERWRKP